MNDKTSLIATVVLMLFFFVSGLLNILDNPVIKILLFAGFVAIIINIIITKSKDKDDRKNLPE